MPKRDKEYMDRQRTSIAQAALTVLLEKGVYETSLRDISRAVGVSMGSLYTHFATKDEIIVAACTLDHEKAEPGPRAKTWDDYITKHFDLGHQTGSRESKRFRLSLQFVADLTQVEENPEGLTRMYHAYRENLAMDLTTLHKSGIITLPHGLELTTEMHMQSFFGAEYQLAADKALDRSFAKDALLTNLAISAGYASPVG